MISYNVYEIDELGKTFNDEVTHSYFYDSEVPNPIKYLNLPVADDSGFILWSFNMTFSEMFYTSEFWPTRITRKDGTTNTYSYEYDNDGYITTVSTDGIIRSTIDWEEF